MAPLLLIAVIFRTMEAFKTFDIAYVMTSMDETELVAIRLYKMAFHEWQTGRSCALAYLMLLAVLAITERVREVPQPPQGEIARWPSFSRRPSRWLEPRRDRGGAGVLVISMIPLYWIGSTAFKPRAAGDHGAADGVLHARDHALRQALHRARVRCAANATRPDYAKAPWWEKLVMDGGDRFIKDDEGQDRELGLRRRFLNSIVIAVIQHASWRWRWAR